MENAASSQRGRHGTKTIYFDDIVVVGAGRGNRGGGPELNLFEIIAPNENPEIPESTLRKAEITVSANEITFSGGNTFYQIAWRIKTVERRSKRK